MTEEESTRLVLEDKVKCYHECVHRLRRKWVHCEHLREIYPDENDADERLFAMKNDALTVAFVSIGKGLGTSETDIGVGNRVLFHAGEGVVVSRFLTTAGDTRYVVECGAALLVFAPGTLTTIGEQP